MNEVIENLIFARKMYIYWYEHDHTQARLLKLLFWGDACLEYRKKLKELT